MTATQGTAEEPKPKTVNISIDEKGDEGTVQDNEVEKGVADEDADRDHEGADIDERRLLRKIDRRILPLLGALYALSLVDRSNLSVARVVGLDVDLGLSIGARYSIVSFVYFVPYILLQLPCNLLVRRLGAQRWLAACVVAWGAVQLAMGFVPNWVCLAVLRALLGAFEAGFFCSLVFIITTWYKRHEVQTRLGVFYLTSVFVAGFSPIFAYAVSLLGTISTFPAWAYIFVIEGAITIIFGAVAWLCVPDFPDRNTFLTRAETAYVLARIEADRGDALPDALSWAKVRSHLLDWKLWAYGLMYIAATTPAYSVGFFMPVILRSMGWSVSKTLLLSAPPYIAAAAVIVVFSYMSDRTRHRAGFIAVQALITAAGAATTGYAHQPGVRYFGLFLTNCGASSAIPGILAYSANNVVSQSKRAVTTAIIISCGGIGGIMATTVFRQQDAPVYHPGTITTIACQVMTLGLLGVLTVHLWVQNARRRRLTEQDGVARFLYTL
ncbi:major facilitator superfamily domain-containing protein [Schizophyllum amplum]|uniref:Major facilitator superfamily domain-containing protein n=1 Tax=Schizophyllum amplum TaxID=97359 RepID=A0A550CWE3_9AGAR|nr:major facilitator superfamily domain-containing protein [Auriculariopsis ampla]